MELKRLKEDKYLWILIIIAVIYILYWSLYANYRYISFTSQYYDIGVEAYSMYWHIHGLQFYPNILDYLVFANHLSPITLLLLPFFALYPHPATPLILQAIFLTLSSIVVYFTTDELLKSRKIGFAMALAFLINPATTGLSLFDFHREALMVFFYILSFYFYMKEKRVFFVISYFLFLSVFETSPIVGATLLVALLLYELLYNRASKGPERTKYKNRLYLLLIAFILTAAFLLFYHEASIYITQSYASVSDSAIVPIQRLINYVSQQFSVLSGGSTATYNSSLIIFGSILGLIVFLFGFGASSIINPIISIITFSPWLAEVLVIHNVAFLNPYIQYYSFGLGGSFVSAILGYLIISKKKITIFGKKIYDIKKYENIIAFCTLLAAILIALTFFLFLPYRIFLLHYAPPLNYTQINQALKLIPANATVMAQDTIAPHLFYIHNLELSPADSPEWFIQYGVEIYWTQPDYIVVDKNLSAYNELTNSTTFNIYNYTKYNYTVYYNQSGLYIFKRIKSDQN